MSQYLPTSGLRSNNSGHIFTSQEIRDLSAHSYHISGSELLANIKAQGSSAFDSLFRELYASLCLFVDRIIDDEEAAKDIVSDLFLNIWNKQELLEAIDDMSAYLYVAAKFRSLNHLKKNEVRRKYKNEIAQIERSGIQPGIDQRIYETETIRLLYIAINELPGECRQVVLLTLQGLSTSEISNQLGISPSAVSNQKSRAIRLLKIKIPMFLLVAVHSVLW